MLLEVTKTDELESLLPKLMRTQVGRDLIAGRVEHPKTPTDADIAARDEAGIRAEIPSLLAPCCFVCVHGIKQCCGPHYQELWCLTH